jgi:hypothetical protein
MASPLISAARTDLQDTEMKTNKVHYLLLGGKKQNKTKQNPKKKRREISKQQRRIKRYQITTEI